jgi:chromosome segregation ATPase
MRMDKEALQRQLEEMEEASERWRAERRRLNSEIDKLETSLADAKAEATRKSGNEKSKAPDPRAIARIQDAADQKLKKAAEEWEGERAKLNSKVNRLEGALAEAIARASNPLRVTQSVKEQFELELNRVAKEKTEVEQAFLRAKTEWEQEKIKMAGEAMKLRRAAQIMGRPVPSENTPETNPKVRDLQNQLKENLARWNSEREQLVGQIRRLEETSRQWDTERRQLSDHADQLQQSLTQAQAKIQAFEVAARKPNPAKVEADELRRENQSLQRQLQESQEESATEQRRLTSEVERLERQLREASQERDPSSNETLQNLSREERKTWEAEQRRLTAHVKELEQQLQQMSGKRDQVNSEVIDQLRRQYEQRLQEAIQQKTQLAEQLQSASASLESERARLSKDKKDGGLGMDTHAIEAEIARVETALNEIVSIIENPNTELSTVIRKNVEKAELDSYLKGMLFTLGRK